MAIETRLLLMAIGIQFKCFLWEKSIGDCIFTSKINPFFTRGFSLFSKKIQNFSADVSRMRDDRLSGDGTQNQPFFQNFMLFPTVITRLSPFRKSRYYRWKEHEILKKKGWLRAPSPLSQSSCMRETSDERKVVNFFLKKVQNLW